MPMNRQWLPRSGSRGNLALLVTPETSWLFGWTDPEVPAAWHGALSLRKGTLVYVHP